MMNRIYATGVLHQAQALQRARHKKSTSQLASSY